MTWKKGQSGNPHGRAISIAQKLIDSGVNPSENVYIPILDKRDPAKELIKLADHCPDKQFKKEIWMFLFAMKYKAVRIMSKPAIKAVEAPISDEDMIRSLEGNKPLESIARAFPVDSTAPAQAQLDRINTSNDSERTKKA